MNLVYIALGANIPGPAGQPDQTLIAAVERIRSLGEVRACSSFYTTAPVGFADQPRFLNAALALSTDLDPETLLEHLLRIEAAFGRDRGHGIKNGPRSLDLDILLYGDLVFRAENLEIPHPRMADRIFVLEPLAEIAPELIHPIHNKTVSQLLSEKDHILKESLDDPQTQLRLEAAEECTHGFSFGRSDE